MQGLDRKQGEETNLDSWHSMLKRREIKEYQQLAFEMPEKRPGFRVEIIPSVRGCLGDGLPRTEEQIFKLITDKKSN